MKFYNVTVRLGGSMNHEVQKTGVSAAEVFALHAIHGAGSIATLEEDGMKKPVKMDELSMRRERARLDQIYGSNPTAKAKLDEVFGTAKSGKLPEMASLADFASASAEAYDIDAEAAGSADVGSVLA
jgi:hypothetical protein